MAEQPKFSEALVIDEEDSDREEIQTILENQVESFTECVSGPQLLRYLDEQPWNWVPDIVFIELILTGMSGYDLIRRMRTRFGQRSIPIIVVTKMGGGEDIVEAQVAGANAFVKKPISADKILRAVKACTEKDSNAKKRMSIGNMIPYFL